MKTPLEKTCSEQLQSLRVAKMKNLDRGFYIKKFQLDLYFAYRTQ